MRKHAGLAPGVQQGLFHVRRGGEAILGVVLQRGGDDRFQVGGDGGIHLANGAFIEREGRFQARVAARQRVVQGGAQGVDIRQRGGFAAILFGRGIALGADHRPFDAGLEGLGDAEVHQDHVAAVIDHHVGGLHVAEDDRVGFMGMQVGQHVA